MRRRNLVAFKAFRREQRATGSADLKREVAVQTAPSISRGSDLSMKEGAATQTQTSSSNENSNSRELEVLYKNWAVLRTKSGFCNSSLTVNTSLPKQLNRNAAMAPRKGRSVQLQTSWHQCGYKTGKRLMNLCDGILQYFSPLHLWLKILAITCRDLFPVSLIYNHSGCRARRATI